MCRFVSALRCNCWDWDWRSDRCDSLHLLCALQELRAHDHHLGRRADAKLHPLALDGEHMDGDRAVEDNRLAGLPPKHKHDTYPLLTGPRGLRAARPRTAFPALLLYSLGVVLRPRSNVVTMAPSYVRWREVGSLK